MSQKSSSLSTGETLCCCEYENWKGERSHILACCCDCEAVDETFDKIFKCEKISSSTIDRVLLTLSDRLRVPMFSGKGAIKLRPDAVFPAVLVPTCLCMATLHPVMTVLSFLFMPISMGIFLSMFRRQDTQRRTIFFYSWALTSLITCYLVFQVFVVAFREVLLWEILLVFTLTVTIFSLLHRVKKNAGLMVVTATSGKQRAGAGGGGHKRTHSNVMPQVASGMLYDQVTGQELNSGHRFYDNSNGSNDNQNTTTTTVPITYDGGVSDPSIQWVDSRMPQDISRSESYCDVCRIHKPPRAGHCPRCEVCVLGRDHHCVWIDSCVGTTNHRHFVAAMFVFVITGLYGVHLTMTTICTPIMLFDWFLWPNDCRWLYIDFLTSICFVTAIYSCLVSCLVLLAMSMQLVMISQNLTGQEFVRATRQRMTRYIFFLPNNPYNKGFFQNWVEFLFLESRGKTPASNTELPL